MRITLFAFPYKVKSRVPGWKGWRLSKWGFVWKEPCDCDNEQDCILVREYGPGEVEEEDGCNCVERPPHTHTWVGYLGSGPIRYPKKKK